MILRAPLSECTLCPCLAKLAPACMAFPWDVQMTQQGHGQCAGQYSPLSYDYFRVWNDLIQRGGVNEAHQDCVSVVLQWPGHREAILMERLHEGIFLGCCQARQVQPAAFITSAHRPSRNAAQAIRVGILE